MMKPISYSMSVALVAAALSLGQLGLGAGTRDANWINQAVAQTPRFLEEHPEFLRPQPAAEQLRERSERRQAYLEKLTRNRALAASPRFLEEHPDLLRRPASATELSAHAKRIRERLQKIQKNSALAASPRIKEQFPALRFKEPRR